MVISVDSQLGLRFMDTEKKIDFLGLMRGYLNDELGVTESLLNKLKDVEDRNGVITVDNFRDIFEREEVILNDKEQECLNSLTNNNQLRDYITENVGIRDIVSDSDSKYFYICQSVYKAAEMIKITENFTGRTLKNIKEGKYTYLMGKHQMVRFIAIPGFIKGFYFDDKQNIAFEWGIEMENGQYFLSHSRNIEFSTIMQVLTFVELGDIEVKYLESLRTNGAKKKEGKIYNASHHNVYVVDSTWNQILIRTEGFAVRGHFRLQPCGEGNKDRKLIWVSAYEKDGYTRKPKATIIR